MSPAIDRKIQMRENLSAGLVVFLISLPLSLGISLASNAPLMSGVIAAIVAGLIVSLLSGSEVSVSGPAAGLATAVVAGQQAVGSFEGFLVAVILAGAFQIVLGMLRAGFLTSLIPTSVIQGMVFGIGVIIIFQQVPHALGLKESFHFEESIFCVSSEFCRKAVDEDGRVWLTKVNEATTMVFFGSLFLLIWWSRQAARRTRFFSLLPGPLAAVLFGVLLNHMLGAIDSDFLLRPENGHLVQLPQFTGIDELLKSAPGLDLSWFRNKAVWEVAFSLAAIASIQSLLSVEASDKLDPARRVSKPNRELVAQGVGNMVSGLLGGLPMTSVIVRSSTNIYAGAHGRLASFTHGILLLLSIILLPKLINMIPLASLGAILLFFGYQLANPKTIKRVYANGLEQLIPFAATTVCILVIDLFTGVLVGTFIGLLVVLKMNHHSSFTLIRDGNDFFLRFAKDVTFLQKFVLRKTLASIPDGANIYIDGGGAMFIDYDIRDVIDDFTCSALERDIQVSVQNMYAYRPAQAA